MIEDWSSINFIQSLNFTTVTKKDFNKTNKENSGYKQNVKKNISTGW